MTGHAELLPDEPDERELDAVRTLIDRMTAASGHPALSEAQYAALMTHTAAGTDAANAGAPVRARIRGGAGGPGDPVVGFAQALPSAPDGHYAVQVVVEPGLDDRSSQQSGLVAAVIGGVAERGGGLVRLWTTWAGVANDRWVAETGLAHERDLVQLRCRLPLAPDEQSPLPTRSFVPGKDETAWLRANNRAFAGHPEQGGWDLETFEARQAEPWFDPAGFLVHDEDGVIAAWCWTKVHGDSDPPMGEIYVIGVDPDFQGRGWGRALTRAGLDWLARTGLSVGMLYVDAANTAAVALYRSLGFTEDHTDRAYSRFVAPVTRS